MIPVRVNRISFQLARKMSSWKNGYITVGKDTQSIGSFNELPVAGRYGERWWFLVVMCGQRQLV